MKGVSLPDEADQNKVTYLELVLQYNAGTVAHWLNEIVQHRISECPDFRRPTLPHVRAMFPAVRRRERLHNDPFEAVHLFHRQNPTKIYK